VLTLPPQVHGQAVSARCTRAVKEKRSTGRKSEEKT
jgi:hypothetical protein